MQFGCSITCTATIDVFQDEQYDHLDEADVAKVEKSANEAMEWMNNKLNLQNKRSLTLDPVIKAKDIQAKTKVSLSRQLFPRVLCFLMKLYAWIRTEVRSAVEKDGVWALTC